MVKGGGGLKLLFKSTYGVKYYLINSKFPLIHNTLIQGLMTAAMSNL